MKTTTLFLRLIKMGIVASLLLIMVATLLPLKSSQIFKPAKAASVIYYVAKNGSDNVSCTQAQNEATPKLTINSALACIGTAEGAGANKMVIVKGGTYNEWFKNNIPGGTSWDAPFTLMAKPGETVILRPDPGADRVFTMARSSTKYVIIDGFIMDAINVTYDAVKITRASSPPSDAAHHIRIQNSEIKNSPGQGILVTGAGYDYSAYNEFINLDVHDNGSNDLDHGLYIETPYNLIEKSRIYRNAGWGIHIYNGYDSVSAHHNIIRNNKIYNNARLGKRGPGMILSSGDGNIAYNNLIWGNNGGIQVNYGATNSQIYNNTIYANNGGPSSFIEGSDRYGILVGSSSQNTTIRNNIIYKHDAGDIVSYTSSVTKDHNLVGINPQFVDPSNFDFHLQPSSPAIDIGLTIAETAKDFDGITRPQGAAYDAGAYEYTASPPPPPPPPPSGDSTPPAVSITAPLPDSNLTGLVTISIAASDNVGVTRVEIWKDSSLFTTLTNVSYTQWDTTKETNGSHTLQAKAYDAANNIGLSPAITVNIQNATTTGTGGGGGSNTKSKKKKKSKTSPIFTQDLALGSQGSDVSRLQTLLSEDPSLYPEQMITGFYGPKTTEAIKRFQAQYGLPVSGRLDQATRAKIAEIFETTEGPTVTTIPEPQPTQTTNQSSLLQERLRRLQLQLIQLLQEQVKLLQNKIKTPR